MPAVPLRFFIALTAGFFLSLALYIVLIVSLIGRPLQGLEGPIHFLEDRRLLIPAQATAPKILLVGGSSVGNGISAKLIQDHTDIPTYNYSFWVPLGAPFMLDRVKQVARPGDTVLLSLEYELYDWNGDTPYWLNESYIRTIASADRDYFRGLSPHEQFHFMMRMSDPLILDLLFRSESRDESQSHSASGTEKWNANGDEIGNIAARKPASASVAINKPLPGLVKGYSSSPKAFPYIKDFVDWAHTHGVKVMATYPNMAQRPEYAEPRAMQTFQKIGEFYQALGVPVLGTPQEAMVPANECYDTPYHLTYEAIQLRTERLLTHWPKDLQHLPPTLPADTSHQRALPQK